MLILTHDLCLPVSEQFCLSRVCDSQVSRVSSKNCLIYTLGVDISKIVRFNDTRDLTKKSFTLNELLQLKISKIL